VSAQSWVVEILDASQGLPSSECTAIAKDYTDHLWVGTTVGLSRYNGYSFENIFAANDNEPIGKVNVIREDDTHRLWIGSDAGLFLRTPAGKFLKVGHSDQQARGVNDLLIAEHKLYIAAEIGPLAIPVDSVVSFHHRVLFENFLLPGWSDAVRLNQVACARDGGLYFSAIHQMFRYQDRQFEKLLETSRSNDQIIAVMPVDKTLCYAFTAQQEDFYRIRNNEITKIVPSKNKAREGNLVFRITRAMGIYEFDAVAENICAVVDVSKHGVLWATQSIEANGMYWIATHDGLVSVKPSGFKILPFKHPSAFPEVYSMLETPDDHFYVGSNHGFIFERKDTLIHQVFDVNPNSEVFDMYADRDDGIWFATGYEGLVYKQRDHLQTFNMTDGLQNNSTNSFFTIRNQLFVAGDGGVTRIDHDAEKISLKPFRMKARRTQYATFYDGIEGPDGKIWVGGQEGIAQLTNDSISIFPVGDKSVYVAGMKKDKSDTVWIAVNGEGIWQCYFDQEGEISVHRSHNKNNGLSVDVFSDVFIDDAQNIWVLHYQGVSVYRRSDHRWLTFDVTDGWPFRNYNHLFLYQDHSRRLWAGCSKGLALMDRERLLHTEMSPQVFLSLSASNPMRQNAVLDHDDNRVTASFYAIDFSNQKNVTYLYKLDGLHHEWVSAGSDREVIFNSLPPGNFTLWLKARNNKGGESKVATFHFMIAKPFWLQSWFVVSCIFAWMMIIYLVITLRENAVRKKEKQGREREIELLSLHRDLAKSKLVALRSQMNPHFIFNALNSVQQFVLQGNADEANQYLSKFARLQRDILNSSDLDFILLDKEIEMLSLYLSLERVRSGDTFEFNIETANDVDKEEIRIPPMLIQPFAENSIWHGLAEKKGEKRVTITFSIEEQNRLRCDVEDNGIGRAAAMERKKNGMSHEGSKGLKLIEERMAMLRQRYNQRFEISINDVIDNHGAVAGTKVSVWIPMDIV
jgi:ligand-binding sensor domain-containing protein